MPRPFSEEYDGEPFEFIWMKEMLAYQMDEVAAALRMSFSSTTLIEIAVCEMTAERFMST